MSNEQRVKDPVVGFYNGKIGENSKGKPRIELYIRNKDGRNDLDELIAHLTNLRDTNPRGAKLEIGVSERTSAQGRKFDSYFSFLKPIQAPPSGFGGGFSTPSPVQSAADQNAAIAALESKQV